MGVMDKVKNALHSEKGTPEAAAANTGHHGALSPVKTACVHSSV